MRCDISLNYSLTNGRMHAKSNAMSINDNLWILKNYGRARMAAHEAIERRLNYILLLRFLTFDLGLELVGRIGRSAFTDDGRNPPDDICR
jgi:hypothetical protein